MKQDFEKCFSETPQIEASAIQLTVVVLAFLSTDSPLVLLLPSAALVQFHTTAPFTLSLFVCLTAPPSFFPKLAFPLRCPLSSASSTCVSSRSLFHLSLAPSPTFLNSSQVNRCVLSGVPRDDLSPQPRVSSLFLPPSSSISQSLTSVVHFLSVSSLSSPLDMCQRRQVVSSAA